MCAASKSLRDEASFKQWLEFYPERRRSHVGPFFGWLNAYLKPYPETMDLKTRVHLRDGGIRPFIELQPTDHPLAVEHVPSDELIHVARYEDLPRQAGRKQHKVRSCS